MEKNVYEIWQVAEDKIREFGFCRLNYIIKNYGKVEKSNYVKVYEGEVYSANPLEKIYEKFNCEIPEDFKGRSLSMSDVVVLNNKAFYCDAFGWEEIEF